MVNILEAILLDKLLCWGYYNEDADLVFLLTTTIDYDEVSKTRRLLIYTLTSVAKIDSSMFIKSLENLKKYARSNACSSIIAYTRNEKILTYMNRLGADIGFNLIEVEVL